jgi:hypothetical protein
MYVYNQIQILTQSSFYTSGAILLWNQAHYWVKCKKNMKNGKFLSSVQVNCRILGRKRANIH